MNEVYVIWLFVLAVGACIGSFLNVVALRALSKESIVFPSSKCPYCNTPIKWYDNIPIFSYFLTIRGKCRSCGEKVSIQYPIVEAFCALCFLLIYNVYGISLSSILLLILICISIVITITDIKKEYVFDSHLWIFIITSLIYSIIVNNIHFALFGLIVGAVVMEIIAKLSYYLIKKKQTENQTDNCQLEECPRKFCDKESEQTQECESEVNESKAKCDIELNDVKNNDQELDINEYVQKYKRAFGEGDTYLASGAGALLGAKMFIPAVLLAIIIQAICILPQFLVKLYRENHIRLLVSLSLFFLLAMLYLILLNFELFLKCFSQFLFWFF